MDITQKITILKARKWNFAYLEIQVYMKLIKYIFYICVISIIITSIFALVGDFEAPLINREEIVSIENND